MIRALASMGEQHDSNMQLALVLCQRGLQVAEAWLRLTGLSGTECRALQVLFIDEAHFIPDLKDFCLDVARSKMVFVAGLDMDYRKERFGQVGSLASKNSSMCPGKSKSARLVSS